MCVQVILDQIHQVCECSDNRCVGFIRPLSECPVLLLLLIIIMGWKRFTICSKTMRTKHLNPLTAQQKMAIIKTLKKQQRKMAIIKTLKTTTENGNNKNIKKQQQKMAIIKTLKNNNRKWGNGAIENTVYSSCSVCVKQDKTV